MFRARHCCAPKRRLVAGGVRVFLLALAGALAAGCTRYVDVERGPQAYYQTGFPFADTSEELEELFESIKRITVTAFYDTYLFSEEDAPLESELGQPDVLARAGDTLTISRSRGATAVLLSAARSNVALVTAHHAVHYPDTAVQYFGSRQQTASMSTPRTRRVRSLSVKRSQSNWIVGLPDMGTFEVLAEDPGEDVAIIGARYPEGELPEQLRALPVEPGDPGRLAWGSFVYVLGHPSGYPMVTRGIVSLPYGEGREGFVVDGLWNEGISGGPVLAVRGDGGGFEWVGMARAASAEVEQRLVPPAGALEEHDPDLPYEGPIYLEEERRIQYGIMLSVPVSAIRRLADEHREALEAQGYILP